MNNTALERFLLAPLRKGENTFPPYSKLLENKIAEERHQTLGNLLAETTRFGRRGDTALLVCWIKKQFDDDVLIESLSCAFWQLADVGRFEDTQQLWMECLSGLEKREEKIDFFMTAVLSHMGYSVYHPLFDSDVHHFLTTTSEMLAHPLKGQASRILSIMQKSMLEQEEFGKADDCDNGTQRIINMIDGVNDKDTILILTQVLFEKIRDARQMFREGERVKQLAPIIEKVFSCDFSWNDVLTSQLQGLETVWDCLNGKRGKTIQEDAFSYLAFVLSHKRIDTSFIAQAQQDNRASALLEQLEALNVLYEEFEQDRKVVVAFLQKSVLVQSGIFDEPYLNKSFGKGRKI